jgi:hypothetical protein
MTSLQKIYRIKMKVDLQSEQSNALRIIINKNIEQFQIPPGCERWVTCMECVHVDGTSVPLLIIFNSENVVNQWIPASIGSARVFSCNLKGCTSNIHGLEWLERVFESSTRPKAGGKYYLLICDGHGDCATNLN